MCEPTMGENSKTLEERVEELERQLQMAKVVIIMAQQNTAMLMGVVETMLSGASAGDDTANQLVS